ncbi:MAG: HAD-IB family phosphatase [Candidatus Omnitrophica bacterium]|nr:HAD-IB family phosphatase [Candidatus Omnitrophota bacterium]
MKPQLLIACDFDGTVTRQDTLVEILNRFGSPRWREIQERVVSGELSIREGLEAEMRTVKASSEELRSLLRDRVEVDPAFHAFLKRVRAHGIPLVCLSGGFDLCLETVLTQVGLGTLPFLANRLVRNNGSWHVQFPYPSSTCSACGHCKGDPIRTWNGQGYRTVFAGNGVTDRCAARLAGLTFAKDELLAWSRAQGVEAVGFSTFADVQRELEDRRWL